jgi:hypothetical protein
MDRLLPYWLANPVLRNASTLDSWDGDVVCSYNPQDVPPRPHMDTCFELWWECRACTHCRPCGLHVLLHTTSKSRVCILLGCHKDALDSRLHLVFVWQLTTNGSEGKGCYVRNVSMNFKVYYSDVSYFASYHELSPLLEWFIGFPKKSSFVFWNLKNLSKIKYIRGFLPLKF